MPEIAQEFHCTAIAKLLQLLYSQLSKLYKKGLVQTKYTKYT